MSKLKNCPFCGGDAEYDYGYIHNNSKSFSHIVRCKDENCIGWSEIGYQTKEVALDIWNTRPTEAETREKTLEECANLLETHKTTLSIKHGIRLCLLENDEKSNNVFMAFAKTIRKLTETERGKDET